MQNGLREYLQPALAGQFENEDAVVAMNTKIARRVAERGSKEVAQRLAKRRAVFLGNSGRNIADQKTDNLQERAKAKPETVLVYKAQQFERYFGKVYDSPIYSFLSKEIVSILFKELYGLSSTADVVLEWSEQLPYQVNRPFNTEELQDLLQGKPGLITTSKDTFGNEGRAWYGFDSRVKLRMMLQAAEYLNIDVGFVTEADVLSLINAGIIDQDKIFKEVTKQLAKVTEVSSVTYHHQIAKQLWPNFLLPILTVKSKEGEFLGKIELMIATSDVSHREPVSNFKLELILKKVVAGLKITLGKSRMPSQIFLQRLLTLANLTPEQLASRSKLTPKQVFLESYI